MRKADRSARCVFTALLLAFVLVSGASAKMRHTVKSPVSTEPSAFVGSTRTLLPDGRLLIAGGEDNSGNVQSALSVVDLNSGQVTLLDTGLRYARAGHVATVLPDGTVLIHGGLGQNGKLVQSPEIFDPIGVTVRLVPTLPPSARAFHTATLLTDGRVVLAGGVLDSGASAKTIELWDPRTGKTTLLSPKTVMDRRNHVAALLPDGRVFFSGGADQNGKSITISQILDPSILTISSAGTANAIQNEKGSLTEMRASSPQDGAQNVAIDALISIRFSRPVQMATINVSTVTLQGPNGTVSAKPIAAEGGMLAFVIPSSSLLPGTSYSVSIGGAVDVSSQTVAYSSFSFSTSGAAPISFGNEEWTPTPDWKTHRAPSKYESLPDLQAAPGKTALAGQVLKLNGEPLAHVTLELGNRRVESDSTGRFLLTDIPSGHQVLVIEGATANSGLKHYGRYEFGDEIKSGITNKLDFKIWMSLLDIVHEVTIPSPTKKETIVTTPTMPGLELHLPPGTVITDAFGKVVTKITITPIPIDRPPFPLPYVNIPIYFTIQPGGAYISVNGGGATGAQLFYPNNEHKKPGVPYAFWNYNSDHNGWYVYGAGHVNKTATQVVPDPGVGIYGFSGAMVGGTGASNQQPINQSGGGDPVDLASGLFRYTKTDLALPDVIPLTLTRTYRQNDTWSRPFGIGTTHQFEIFLEGDGNVFGQAAYLDLILTDGQRIHFIGVGAAPPYSTYLNSSAATRWYGATIGTPFNPNNYPLPGQWQLQTKDGTIYSFPESAGAVQPGCEALVGITDRHGNQIKIQRNTDTNCTIAQVTSPSGRYIQFTYDSSYRVKTATDNSGRQVQYNYDPSGRLQTVIDANSGTWTYGYDSLNRMTTINDPRLPANQPYLTNTYTSAGMVYRQTLADQTSYYQFNWTTTSNSQNVTFSASSGSGGPAPYQVVAFRSCSSCNEGFDPLVSQVDVIDPRGYTREVVFNQFGYPLTDTLALGMPEQEKTQYLYYADNLVNTVTDQLQRVTSYSFDANSNPTSVTWLSGTPNAVTAQATYDSIFNQLLTYTDPMNNVTTLAYDSYGDPTAITDPLGHQTSIGYNGMGLVTSVADALQNTTQFIYSLEDLIGIVDPMQNTTTLFHDPVGRVISRTDSLGNTTQFQYSPLNQLTQVTDSLQGITTLTYDPNGNLSTVQDALQHGTNNKTVFAYDAFDHLQTRTDQLNRQESYVFDQLGNLKSFTDRRGKVTTYSYDGINRRTFAGFGTQPGPTYESTINYTYDGGDRLKTIVDSSFGTITPVFDGLNRLTSETTPNGSVSYTYDNDSRRLSATVAGQTSNCYSWDNGSRLTGIGQGTCPVSTNTTSFTYDNANRRSTMTLSNGIVLTYGYDNDSRINSLSYQLGTTQIGSLTSQYDASGRKIQTGGSLAATTFPNAVSSAVYDVSNEATSWNGTAISYDNNGNVLSDGTAAYTWNARNQLVTRASTNFKYDPFGRRTLNPAGKNLLYDALDVAQELTGSTPSANRVIGRTDEFFARTDSTGTYDPITNDLSSVLALTNSAGAIVTQYTYDPFGGTTVSGATSSNRNDYTGRENDSNGLYYYRARYFSPSMGRFLSEDPSGFHGGINLYAYSLDNPTSFTDPSGRNTGNVGGAGGCAFWGFSFGGSAGFVVDSQGNLGAYQTPINLGGGAGNGCSFGFTAGGSNANTICDFGGPFVEYSASGGLVAGGGASVYTGFNSDGSPIVGGSATIGLAGGADVSVAGTVTSVTAMTGRKPCSNTIPPISF